ncbi:MAG: peptidyl-tRNA hydrolase Pth2 [Nanoarchaeota archaeon]|nr:peptidyl-tRNA hydrolase Pth2 [Nanoarchaeota archaeon]
MKQVILVRKDLKLPKGKMAAQCAHASVSAVLKSDQKMVQKWKSEGMAKIVLYVENEKELLKFEKEARKARIKCALITDAGRTTVAPGTVTCLGIGPDDEEEIDAITGDLKLI